MGQGLFVVAEIALSLLLLVAAGLFVRSLQHARSVDRGLDVDKLVSMPLSVNLLRYTRAQGRAFYEQVVERAQRLPASRRPASREWQCWAVAVAC